MEKTRAFYENNIYGKWRSGETVSYEVLKESRRQPPEKSDNPFANMFRLSTEDDGTDVEIGVSAGTVRTSFTVRVYLPSDRKRDIFPNGNPFIVCMHPIQPKDFVLSKGYALIFLDTAMVAEDNCLHKGVFYELYPYGKDSESQTGELMAWSWEASKVLDACENGLAEELGLNKDFAMITGVSRWGKATAVCGAFEKRFKVTIPVCSGAGGLALWGYKSEGREYDLSFCGASEHYVYEKNEPLDCLQSEAERGWFVDRFLEYKNYGDIEVEQYMLPVLAADKERYYFIVAAWTGEDWVNAPAMDECYKLAKAEYGKLGLSEHIFKHFHTVGHAILEEDLEYIFDTLGTIAR